MRKISSRSSSYGRGNLIGQNRTFNSSSYRGEKLESKEIIATIKAANSKVSTLSVFKHYGVNVSKSAHSHWSNPVICPFPHNGGIERTPSFGYNFQDSRWHCFGCKKHGRAVEFIAYKEGKSKYDVARAIIGDGVSEINCEDYVDNAEEIERIMFYFSRFCNKLVQKNKYNPAVVNEIRKVQWFVDCYINSKAPTGNLDKESLEWVLERARELLT